MTSQLESTGKTQKGQDALTKIRGIVLFIALQMGALFFLYGMQAFQVVPLLNILAIYAGIAAVGMFVIFKTPKLDSISLPDCKACFERMRRIFASSAQYQSATGKGNIWNPVILTKEDYDAIRSDPRYWKCDYCSAINPDGNLKCLSCSADRKEAPRKVAV